MGICFFYLFGHDNTHEINDSKSVEETPVFDAFVGHLPQTVCRGSSRKHNLVDLQLSQISCISLVGGTVFNMRNIGFLLTLNIHNPIFSCLSMVLMNLSELSRFIFIWVCLKMLG